VFEFGLHIVQRNLTIGDEIKNESNWLNKALKNKKTIFQ